VEERRRRRTIVITETETRPRCRLHGDRRRTCGDRTIRYSRRFCVAFFFLSYSPRDIQLMHWPRFFFRACERVYLNGVNCSAYLCFFLSPTICGILVWERAALPYPARNGGVATETRLWRQLYGSRRRPSAYVRRSDKHNSRRSVDGPSQVLCSDGGYVLMQARNWGTLIAFSGQLLREHACCRLVSLHHTQHSRICHAVLCVASLFILFFFFFFWYMRLSCPLHVFFFFDTVPSPVVLPRYINTNG
jgi:hypothetical protein